VGEAGLGESGASLVGAARVRCHASDRLPLHLQARLPEWGVAGPLAVAARCAFYGAFAAKILIVELRRFPTAVLPAAGGLVFVILVGVWYTSALWFFGSSASRSSRR
jgi:ABC-type sulfate transport system permease subunit